MTSFAARDSFSRAVLHSGEPENDRGRRQLADASVNLGHAYGWKGMAEDAARAYAVAMEWEPNVPNYAQLFDLLGEKTLRTTLDPHLF